MKTILLIFSPLKKDKKAFLCFSFFLWTFLSQAQSVESWTKTVSPKEILARYISKKDTNDLGYTLIYINHHFLEYARQDIFELLMEGAEHAEKHNVSYLSDYYMLIRKFYTQLGDKSRSLEYALKIYHLQSKTGKTEPLLWIMVDVGNIFYLEKDYDQANVFYEKAEHLALKSNDAYALSVIYLNFGMVADKKQDYKLALDNYSKSCNYRVEAGNIKLLSSTYIKIAGTLMHLKQYEKALHYIHLTEEYYYHKGKESDLLNEIPMFVAFEYADYYQHKDDFAKSDMYLMQGRKLAQEGNFYNYYLLSFFQEATYQMQEGKYKEAIATVNNIIPELKKRHLLDDLKNVYEVLSKCYSKTNNLPKAAAAFENYILLNDSLNHSAMKSQLNTMRTLTAVFESDNKLHSAKKNLEIADMTNALQTKQRSVFYLIFSVGTVALLVLLLLFLNLRKNKKKLQQLHFKSLLQNNEIKVKSTELQRSDQIKDKLFSIIAHDLRNPLNRLLVELAIVKKTINDQKLIEPMENTLKETIGLFERLLQWSKMDNKQNIYSPVKINLNDNVNKVITFYLPEMQLREITIVNNSETMLVFVDPNILQTLLRNFLSNAISLAPKAGVIEIEAKLLDEDTVELVFSDSGPGFSEEVLHNFHVEKNDLNSGNNGLGLTLCKVLAKMSGWPFEISNESKHGGARVSIVLPIFKEKKKSGELNVISRAFQPTDDWKDKLWPILELKFYQTSQIRTFLKSLGNIDDPQVRLWVRQIERAVHQGDKETYAALMDLIRAQNIHES